MHLCVIGNYSIHTRRWVRYFSARGDRVHLITMRPAHLAGPQGAPLPPGVTLTDLTALVDVPKLRYPLWVLAVRRIVRRMAPDILHAHQVAGAGWLAAAAGRHPLVVTAWGSDLLVGARRSPIQRRLAGWTLRRADQVTCVSHTLARAALTLGADPARLEVAPWGVDTTVYCPAEDRAALRRRLGLGSGPVVLCPRSLKALYNPLDIAHAVPAVLAAVPDATFVVRTHICDPDLLARFQSVVAEARVPAEAVRYVGDLPDEEAIADLYRAADLIVSVPSSDGTPSSVLEALACGAVPVLSDLESLREWVQPEEEGLYVPVGDGAAISRAVIRLLDDRDLWASLRERGQSLIRSRADGRVWMQHYEDLYRRLLQERKS